MSLNTGFNAGAGFLFGMCNVSDSFGPIPFSNDMHAVELWHTVSYTVSSCGSLHSCLQLGEEYLKQNGIVRDGIHAPWLRAYRKDRSSIDSHHCTAREERAAVATVESTCCQSLATGAGDVNYR